MQSSNFLIYWKCRVHFFLDVTSKIVTKQNTSKIHNQTAKPFTGTLDRYNGVTVSSENEKCSPEEFPQKLQYSLKRWEEDNRRGIWFKVNTKNADWVPELAKNGFKFHHALENFVVMFKWLPINDRSKIPAYAHTILGVGGVAINKRDQILVVSEKYYNRPHWKLPGGYVNAGENLAQAAVREVHEETGITVEYETVLSLRHAHLGNYGCSDIYALVALNPLSDTIHKSDSEIAACKWMYVHEYMNHPLVYGLNKLLISKFLEYKRDNVHVDLYAPIDE